jgi:hypothetical protein
MLPYYASLDSLYTSYAFQECLSSMTVLAKHLYTAVKVLLSLTFILLLCCMANLSLFLSLPLF